MADNEQNTKDKPDRPINNYVKYSGIGFQMIAIIGVLTFAGYKIDEHLHHELQWVTAVMALVGVFVSLYIVIRSLKE